MVIEPVPSLFSYFRDAITAVSVKRKIAAASETTDYLANLLVDAGTHTEVLHRSIVLTLDEALSRGPGEQFVGLQAVGDGALYLVSFFPEHLERERVDTSLYVSVGAFAYGRAAQIARTAGSALPRVLIDLNEHFTTYANVLGEVAASSALGAVTKDLVKLFDRWKQTGSSTALAEMARRGAFPVKGGHRC
jgi:hypothetical protein